MLVWVVFLLAASADGLAPVTGSVVDATGGVLPGVQLVLLTDAGSRIANAESDAAGTFALSAHAGTYLLEARKQGFATRRQPLRVAAGGTLDVRVILDLAPRADTITVTAVRGDVQSVRRVPQSVDAVDADVLSGRALITAGDALADVPGVSAQQTTTSQSSPFVRGLTGQHVVMLLDGVRFNTATFRPGANQYIALVDPFFIERAEVLRGPSSAPYGSDALGGVISLTTGENQSRGVGRARGAVTTAFRSADESAAAAAAASFSGSRWTASLAGSWRRVGDLRAGGGLDSHSVATRLLGLESRVLGTRLQDTAFTQEGVRGTASVQQNQNTVWTFRYVRGAQHGARRYDLLNGGSGNLIAGFDPQRLDFGVVRFERLDLGRFEHVTLSGSYNRQRDDRTLQTVNNSRLGLHSPITEEHNLTRAIGVQAGATGFQAGAHRVNVGAELYQERVASRRIDFGYNPATEDFTIATPMRARYPDAAAFRSFGTFVQHVLAVSPDRLATAIGLRYSHFRYQPPGSDSWPADPAAAYRTSLRLGDTTFDAGAVWTPRPALTVRARAARGFRAPNINDLATVGLSGNGFEIPPEDAARRGAFVSRFGDTTAGTPVAPLGPEVSWSYETGAQLRRGRIGFQVQVFRSTVSDFIERMVVRLPSGATNSFISGQPIVRQAADGSIYTPLSANPVFVRANGGRIRMTGWEAAFDVGVGPRWTMLGHFSGVRALDVETGQAPGLENGVPPPGGRVALLWRPAEGPFWVEGHARFALRQTRFSANDLQQARIGGLRSAQEIRDFFYNGAIARGLVQDGVVVTTGESLAEVMQRVLGPAGAPNALFTSLPGHLVFDVRVGRQLGSSARVVAACENMFDRNYRVMGSGVDGPGVNFTLRYSRTF